jgi:hypothetical protein
MRSTSPAAILDELILLPLAIALVVKMIPPEIMAQHRAAAAAAQERPVSRTAAAVIVAVWAAAIGLTAWLAWLYL